MFPDFLFLVSPIWGHHFAFPPFLDYLDEPEDHVAADDATTLLDGVMPVWKSY
jgi:hypothetical protein